MNLMIAASDGRSEIRGVQEAILMPMIPLKYAAKFNKRLCKQLLLKNILQIKLTIHIVRQFAEQFEARPFLSLYM